MGRGDQDGNRREDKNRRRGEEEMGEEMRILGRE